MPAIAKFSEPTTFTPPNFDYPTLNVGDIKIVKRTEHKFGDNTRTDIDTLQIGDHEAQPSQRFWDSFCARFGFGHSTFRYFTHEEVFNRISQKSPKANIRVAVQTEASSDDYGWAGPKLFGVSAPEKPLLEVAPVADMLNKLDVLRMSYSNGVFVTRHQPRVKMEFEIGNEKHETRLCLETPLDGYGKPNVYLAMLRLVCSNGAVAMAKAFQSSINIGTDALGTVTLMRIMEAYNNEDGFAALKQRFASAQTSWASISEVQSLAKMVWKLSPNDFRDDYIAANYTETPEKDKLRNDILKIMYNKTGDVREIYGVSQVESISQKRMRMLPTEAKVYDLINLASEASTHWLRPESSSKFSHFIGDLVAAEYDLEASGQEFGEFSDFMNPNTKVQRVANN